MCAVASSNDLDWSIQRDATWSSAPPSANPWVFSPPAAFWEAARACSLTRPKS